MSQPTLPHGYSAEEVASVAGLSVSQVLAFVKAGLLTPACGDDGRPRFGFRDLAFLRNARRLGEQTIPQRKLQRTLRQLKSHLPADRPISVMALDTEGPRVVVKDAHGRWDADSGQRLLDLDRTASVNRPSPKGEDANRLYDQACDLEELDVQGAIRLYRQALQCDPQHVDAHVNLGRMLHLSGKTSEAAGHYRQALKARPDDPLATFNLAIALEDLGMLDEAIATYSRALELDGGLVDAYFNLSRLYEQKGEKMTALRHLKDYRRLARPE